MREQADWAERTASGEAASVLYAEANAEAYSGRFRSAEEWFRKAKEKSARNVYGAIPLGLQEEFAIQQAEVGNTAGAQKLLPSLSTESKDRKSRLDLAMLLARVGETEKANELADALSHEYPLDTLVQNYSLPIIRAAIKLQKNDPQGAIESLRPTVKYELSIPDTFNTSIRHIYAASLICKWAKGRSLFPNFRR